jgi:hypothetical protein
MAPFSFSLNSSARTCARAGRVQTRLVGAEGLRALLDQAADDGPFAVRFLPIVARRGQSLDQRARLGAKLEPDDAGIGDLLQRRARLVAEFEVDCEESHLSSLFENAQRMLDPRCLTRLAYPLSGSNNTTGRP